MSQLVADVRNAFRALRQQPAVSLVIVVTLALAIGANSAIFTVINAVLLRSLPYSEPERVVMLFEVDPRGRDALVSVPMFEDWQRTLRTITGVSLVAGQTANLTGVPEPDRLRAGFVTSSFFDMRGVQPIMGRTFVSGEDHTGAHKTVILTYQTWQNRFGSDPSVIGRALILNNEPHEVIGVLPRSFEYPMEDAEVWMPYSSYPIQDRQRTSRNAMAMGRIRSEVSFEATEAELRQVAGDLARAYPDTNTNWSARYQPFHEVTVRFVGRNLQLLWGAVGFVLLIACANDKTSEQQWEFHRRVIEQIGRVPGVRVSSLARAIPQSGNGGFVGFWRSEDARPSQDAMPRAQYNAVSSEFFTAMSIPVYEGRVCGAADTPEAPLTLMLNRLLAERLWPGESAVGKRLRKPDFPTEAVIVGVVGNTRPQLLSTPMGPQIYGCLSQQPGIFALVIAKTAGEPMALARGVQQAVWSVDPDQPVWKIRSSESLLTASVQTQRFVMLLMSLATGLALLLAGLGTYSVLSYTVQRRAREVGVRMALGATRGNIVRLVLGHTAVLTLVGVGVGLVGAFVLARLVATQLYEISPRDPWTFLVTALTLIMVAFTAAWLPTRHATSVDPVVTLRTE